jgi:hypothetical protein
MKSREYYIGETSRIYKEKKLGVPFCEDLAMHLKDKGYKKVSGFSYYTNVFSRGSYPQDRYKLKLIYDYINEYPSNADSGTKEGKEPSKMDDKKPSECEPHLT